MGSVLDAAIRTFVDTCDTNHGPGKGIPEEEYAQISPLLDKWRTRLESPWGDQEAFSEFEQDLKDFSQMYPEWFDESTVWEWFDTQIWALLRGYYERAQSLCHRIEETLATWEGRIGSLLSSNYACIDPFEFEALVAELFAAMGYEVEVTPKSGDYGVDVIARRASDTVAIQAKKHSPGNNVGNRDVQRLLGAMQLSTVRANKAILITTSDFTVQAQEQAREAPIELWNGDYFSSLVRKYLS